MPLTDAVDVREHAYRLHLERDAVIADVLKELHGQGWRLVGLEERDDPAGFTLVLSPDIPLPRNGE